jgi:autophagy-related protein 2
MPAYFQKRLLRTALSRIALLDVDSLDLDSLGVKIGRSSTVELKNVGLRVQVYMPALVPSFARLPDTP